MGVDIFHIYIYIFTTEGEEIMGKILDFIFADTWEEYKRIQLYKKIEDRLDEKESNNPIEIITKQIFKNKKC